MTKDTIGFLEPGNYGREWYTWERQWRQILTQFYANVKSEVMTLACMNTSAWRRACSKKCTKRAKSFLARNIFKCICFFFSFSGNV